VVDRARPSLLAVLAAVFALAVVLPGLGASDFTGDDEALDAGVIWTIHTRGDWLFPEFNDEYLPPKPPLFYWLAAGISAIRGRADEWSVRLPSALLGAATVFLTVIAGARMVGNGGALLAGLALSVMPVFRDQARLGRADMTMTFIVTAALFLFFLRPSPLARADRWLFFSLLGLAALAKGAAGVGVVAVVVAVDAWWDRQRARSLVDPAILAFFVIGAFWYALGGMHWGERFVLKHVVGENFRHFFGTLVVDEKPVRSLLHHLSHFVNVFTGTAPWGFLLPFALTDRGTRAPTNLRRWFFAGFVFFTLATRKSPYYLLPVFPPLALLVGEWAWRRIAAERAAPVDGRALLRWGLGGVCVVVGVLVAWQLAGAPGLDADRHAAIRELGNGAPLLWLALAIAAAATGVAIGGGVAGRTRELVTGALVGGFVVAQILNAVEIPLARVQSLRRFAREAASATTPGEPLFFFELPLPAIALYAERTIPTLSAGEAPPSGRFVLIVPESLEARVPASWGVSERALVEERARVFTRRPMWIRLRAGGGAEEGKPATRKPRRRIPARRRKSRPAGKADLCRLVVVSGLALLRRRGMLAAGERIEVAEQRRSGNDGSDDQRPGHLGRDVPALCRH
jgi:4-amino-4-deoxy-L-arabinose transferase-like glycosyltransferase